MATLEVHDGRGRVERVTITRDQPVMFGSSPMCEIVMTGGGILPFHGRVRWKGVDSRFKVDASPEAQYVLVNGHKMASSSFKQGDEVEVGTYRIFMINDSEPAPTTVPPQRDDVTRVQPPPFIAPPAAGAVIRRGSWRESRGEDGPPAEADPRDDDPTRGRRDRKRARDKASAAATAVAPEPKTGWAALLRKFSPRGYAPGQEEVYSSPLVFGLFVTFCALVLVGVSLYGIITRTAASRLYNQAVENLEDGDYRNAIKRFDEFLKANPEDPRAGKARVHRAMADVRQYTSAAGASWSLALEAEKAMVETAGREEAFRDSSPELDEIVLKTGESLADRAKSTADPKVLTQVDEAVALHNKLAGKSAPALLSKSRIPEKLESARAAVRKAGVRRGAFAAMDAALKEGSSKKVYEARDALTAQYADQAGDRELVKRMTSANDLIRKAVTVDTSGRPAESEPHPLPFGPPTTLVLRVLGTGQTTLPAPPKPGPLVFARADGVAYGLDAATGTPLWQAPVGLASPFPPVPVPGGSTVLAFDVRHDELVLLDARTGKFVWRQEIGEPLADPPLLLGNQVIQATPGGKLLLIDLPTGSLRATVNLGLPLARTPVCDESGQALYVAAEQDCLFVLTRDPLECVGVEYLGHAPGSIACPPARLGRYLVVAENHELNEGRWQVFVLSEDGVKLTHVQDVPVLGWTWGTPATAASVIWAAGDRGGVAAYAVGAYGAKDPFRLIARIPPDADPSGPAFALARSERELWVGSGRSGRYELNPEGQTVEARWTLAGAGPALAPPQLAAGLLVLSQQNVDGPGLALWGVEPVSGNVKWRTVLGAPWPSPPSPAADGRGLDALGADGHTLSLTRDSLAKGGFVTSPIPRPGGFRLPTRSGARVDGEGWTAIVPGRGAGKILVREGQGEFKEVGLPAPLGAKPVAWGRDLFVPGADGRAYLIDPLTGESRAEPFVPPFDRNRRTRWLAPTPVGGEAVVMVDDSGKVRRLVRLNDPRPRLSVSAETSLGKGVVTDPASTKGAVVVVTGDGRARALAAADLSPLGAWTLDAPLALPPSAVAGRCFLADTTGGVLAVGEDGQRLWSVKLPGASSAVAEPPAVRGETVWLLARDGSLHARSLADGSPVARTDLGVLPADGPVACGADLVVPVGPGTLRLLTVAETPAPAESPAGRP